MRVGLQLSAGTSVLDIVPQIERAEAAGFATAWTAGRFDALMQLILAASSTSRIELGTGIVSIYQRHPMAMAQQALTVQSASDGRHALGIGASHRFVIESALGFDWKPIRQMREYLRCLVPLLAGESVTFHGRDYRLTEFQLPVAAAVEKPPPVVVAALGPQMLRLTGRLADGTIIFLGGTRYLREVAIPMIREAAAEAGRPAPRIVAGVPVCVTDRSPAAVREEVAPGLGGYDQRPSYKAILDMNGSSSSAEISIIGDENDVRGALKEYASLGVTDFLASTVGDRPDEQQRTYEVLADVARTAG